MSRAMRLQLALVLSATLGFVAPAFLAAPAMAEGPEVLVEIREATPDRLRIEVNGAGFGLTDPGIDVSIVEEGSQDAIGGTDRVGTDEMYELDDVPGNWASVFEYQNPADFFEGGESYEVWTRNADGQNDPGQETRTHVDIDVSDFDPEPEPEPTPTPTPDSTGSPTPTPAPTPTTTPPPTAKVGCLDWGVRTSFRNYIRGTIATGEITVSGGAIDHGHVFRFGQSSTTADLPDSDGTTNYAGTVRFTGHEGKLDLRLAAPRIEVDGDRAVLSYAVTATNQEGEPVYNGQRINLVDVDLDDAESSGAAADDSFAVTNAPANLTADGNKALSDFYPVGAEMDRVSFVIGSNVSSGAAVPCGPPAKPPVQPNNPDPVDPGPANPNPSDDSGEEGHLDWGVKASWRSYIVGSIARGSISVGDGASSISGGYRFTQISRNLSADTTGTAGYGGRVVFTGHGGLLDISMSDPTVHVESSSRGMVNIEMNGKRVDIVSLDLSDASRSKDGTVLSVNDAPARLTSAGAKAFATGDAPSTYSAGETMDPVSFTIGSNGNASGGMSRTESSSSVGAGGLAAVASVGPPAAGGCPVESASLRWGMKESFRSYISGTIANGSWTTAGGASYSTPEFAWSQASGDFDAASRKGRVAFAGSIRFTGHKGALDTSLSDPELLIDGTNATLVIDVAGVSRESAEAGAAEREAFDNVGFANVDLRGATVDGSTLTVQNAPVTLTADGAKAFSSYPAGTAFDPVTFTVTSASDCASDASAVGQDRRSPVAALRSVSQWPALALLAAGAGIGATLISMTFAITMVFRRHREPVA